MIILGMGSANERLRYIVMSIIGWAHTQNEPCLWDWMLKHTIEFTSDNMMNTFLYILPTVVSHWY